MRAVLNFVCLVAVAVACGFTTHDFIAHRAREHYYSDAFGGKYAAIVENNIDALQGGAPFPGKRFPPFCVLRVGFFPVLCGLFPDYLYTCGSDHNAGEGEGKRDECPVVLLF
jgi:hypothetical protein